MNSKNITILYIEDDDIARENGIEYLENYSDTVYEASNAIDGLKLYHRYKPDIIITDIQMPRFNGLDFVKEIRKNDDKTQVIITTAYSDKEYLLKAIELKLVKYLIKPISEKDFEETLEICIDQIKKDESNIINLSSTMSFDIFNKTLIENGNLVKLRTKEVDLLSLLIRNKERFVSYVEIENYVWEESVMTKDALKTLIKNLKVKLPQGKIKNLSGTGYKIEL